MKQEYLSQNDLIKIGTTLFKPTIRRLLNKHSSLKDSLQNICIWTANRSSFGKNFKQIKLPIDTTLILQHVIQTQIMTVQSISVDVLLQIKFKNLQNLSFVGIQFDNIESLQFIDFTHLKYLYMGLGSLLETKVYSRISSIQPFNKCLSKQLSMIDWQSVDIKSILTKIERLKTSNPMIVIYLESPYQIDKQHARIQCQDMSVWVKLETEKIQAIYCHHAEQIPLKRRIPQKTVQRSIKRKYPGIRLENEKDIQEVEFENLN